jgi:peroxiredoxin
MKQLAVIVLVFAQCVLLGQNSSFTIQGKVGDLNAPAIAFLRYSIARQTISDSVVLKNGRFEFKGSVQDPTRASILLYHKGKSSVRERGDYLTLYLDKGTIRIDSKDSLKDATITGSKINADNQKMTNALKPFEEKRKIVQQIYKNATEEDRKSESFRISSKKEYDEMIRLQKDGLKRFIQENPDSWLCLDALNTIGGSVPDITVVEPIFNSLSDQVKNSADGRKYSTRLAALKLLATGLPAPDFTQNNPDGKPVKLSDFKGKYLLLDFWASWCGPCRAENPHAVKAFNQYKDKNFTILSVSLDKETGKEAWLKAIQDDHLTWNHVSDLKFWNNAVAVQYGIHSVPDNFLIGPDGKIIARGLRGDALASKLAELIK